MEDIKTVEFDPGYAPLVIDSIGQVGYTYYMFCAINDIKTKKMNFLGVSLKLEKLLKVNAAFYLGCLLWASYIKKENALIEGNQLFGEECDEVEYTKEIDFLIDLVENKLPRDYKYFKNQKYLADEKYIPIFKAYREFLTLNKGFVQTSETEQIVLPENLKKLSGDDLDWVYLKITQAIESRDMTLLFDCYNVLF